MQLASAARSERSTTDDRRHRRAKSLHLRLSHHAAEQLHEVRVLAAGRDVLPAISTQHSLADSVLLGGRKSTLAQAHEIAGVRCRLTLQQMIQAAHERDQIVDRRIARLGIQRAILAAPFDLVHHRVLAFLEPVEAEDVAIQVGELFVALDAFAVMNLREQFHVAGHRQHGPGGLAEHRARDFVGVSDQHVTARHLDAECRLDAAEQLLMLDLLFAETHQAFERDLVAQAVADRDLQRLGADEALQQPEDAGITAPLHITHHALLLRDQEQQINDLDEPVRQELAAEVEAAAPKHIGVDVPADALRRLDAAGVAGAVAVLLEQALGGGRNDEIDGGVHDQETLSKLGWRQGRSEYWRNRAIRT